MQAKQNGEEPHSKLDEWAQNLYNKLSVDTSDLNQNNQSRFRWYRVEAGLSIVLTLLTNQKSSVRQFLTFPCPIHSGFVSTGQILVNGRYNPELAPQKLIKEMHIKVRYFRLFSLSSSSILIISRFSRRLLLPGINHTLQENLLQKALQGHLLHVRGRAQQVNLVILSNRLPNTVPSHEGSTGGSNQSCSALLFPIPFLSILLDSLYSFISCPCLCKMPSDNTQSRLPTANQRDRGTERKSCEESGETAFL